MQEVERPRAVLFAAGISGVTFLVIALRIGSEPSRAGLHEFAFWVGIVLVVNLFPVAFGELRLSMDMPLLMAVALLYPPATAAAVAAIAALDSRELMGRVAFSRAAFNRSQVALSVFVASETFTKVSVGLEPWPKAILATALAIVASYTVNVVLVVTYAALRLGPARAQPIRLVRTAVAPPFLGTYLGYGLLGLVLARLFADVGPWSVASFLLPLLVARAMIVRAQAIEVLAQTLKNREHLLEGVFDRVVDERRDERLRIAGDLHDDVLQTVIGIRMLAGMIQSGVAPLPGSQQIKTDTAQLVATADETLQSIRSVIQQLHHSPVGREGLIPTLSRLVQDLRAETRSNIALEIRGEASPPGDLQILVYQVAREALINAVNHAHANSISMRMSFTPSWVELEVTDDGIGFSPDATQEPLHFGLGLMRERARLGGGRLEIVSSTGSGTKVRAALPVRRRPPDESSQSIDGLEAIES